MHARQIRLSLALLIAFIGHIAILYQAPEPVRIPLTEQTYSIDVELTTEQSTPSFEDTPLKGQGIINSTSKEESKPAKEEPKITEPQTSKPKSGNPQNTEIANASSANVKLNRTESDKNASDNKHDHHFNVKTDKINDQPPKKIKGHKTESPSEVETEKTETTEIKTETHIPAKQQKASEDSQANTTKSIKTEKSTPQVLTATEQYEARIYAWILNGPNSRIFSGISTEGQKLTPIKIRTTWSVSYTHLTLPTKA